MANYRTTVVATSNSVADTDDTFISLQAAANQTLLLKRLRISTKTPAKDDVIHVKIVRRSDLGSGSTSFTPVPTRIGASAALATGKVKNGTSAFAVGTITATLDEFYVNGRSLLDIPLNYESASNGYFGVVISRSDASIVTAVEVEHEE